MDYVTGGFGGGDMFGGGFTDPSAIGIPQMETKNDVFKDIVPDLRKKEDPIPPGGPAMRANPNQGTRKLNIG